MQGLEKIWKDKHVSLQTKTRIVNAMIFPVILHGCETWTKTREMEKKIDACEMWIWRKMLRVSWTEKRTNESILMEIGQARGVLSLRERAAKQKMIFFGHVMRANSMEKDMMMSCCEGRRKRGRPKKEMDGGNTQDVMDESGGAEGCGGGSGRVGKTDHVNR